MCPDPRKGSQTSVPHRGSNQQHVSTLTRNGLANHTSVLPTVTTHMHLNMLLIPKEEHDAELRR